MANIIADINDRGHLFQSSIDSFFQKLNISGLLSRSNFYKEAGSAVLIYLKSFSHLSLPAKTFTELSQQRILNYHSERIPLTVFSTADILTGRNFCIWS
jgi:hypothetical protein